MTAKSSIISLSPLSSLKSLFTLAALTCCLTSCVKEPLYDTDHPNHGMLTLTTTWNDRGEGIEIPANYTVKIGDYSAVLQGTANSVDNLFPAGQYSIHIYNAADGITVSGTTATADYTNPAFSLSFGEGRGEVFFTGTETIKIEKDKKHHLTIAMHQMVRQLTLELNLTGNAAGRITGISASLSGVAGAIDITNGNPTGSAVTVPLSFNSLNSLNSFAATTRLLGITGSTQTLSLTLHFEGDTSAGVAVSSDLSDKLAAFNVGRKTSLTLKADIETAATPMGVTAEINNWTGGGNANGIAN